MKTTDRMVDRIMPPATGADRVARAGAGAGGNRQRQHAEDERQRRHEDRPQADAAGLERRIHDRLALLAQLLGELDDQDRVLGGEADQHHQADLAEDVVRQAAQPLRRERAEDGERHASRMMNGSTQLSYCAASTR